MFRAGRDLLCRRRELIGGSGDILGAGNDRANRIGQIGAHLVEGLEEATDFVAGSAA